MVCEKLDPLLCTCADHPGVRCVDVPSRQCKPKFASSKEDKKAVVA